MKLYENENIFLGESGNILSNCVNYDFPQMKKTIEQAQKQIQELTKKEADWTRTAQQYRSRFTQQCKDMNIEGKDIRSEVNSLTNGIPQILVEVVELVRDPKIKQAIQFYETFTKYVLGTQQPPNILLQNLKSIIENGDTPLTKSDPTVVIPSEKEEDHPIEIDWTIINEPTNNEATPVVSWDIAPTNLEDNSSVTDIVWDINPTEGTESQEVDTQNIEVLETAEISDVTAFVGQEASKMEEVNQTFLSQTTTRIKLLDDLLELQSFILQRKSEMEAKKFWFYYRSISTGSTGITATDSRYASSFNRCCK